MNKIKKLISVLKDRSIDGLLDLLAWNTPEWLFFYSHAYLVTSPNPSWAICLKPGYTMRLADEWDVELFEKIGMRREVFLSRLRAGDRGAIVLSDGEILTMAWGAIGRMFIRLCGIEFDSGATGCFYYGAYTSEKARNKGLFSSARQFLFSIYASEGRTCNWGAISANNAEWLKAILRNNYSKMGEVYFIRLLFLNISYRKSWPFPTRKLSIFINNPTSGIKYV